MKYGYLFSALIIGFLFSISQAYADGCLEPKYIEKLTEKECMSRKGGNPTNCYIEGKCYVGINPSVCNCLKLEGTVCRKDVPGTFFNYCKWNNNICDTWRLLHGMCFKETAITLDEKDWKATYCRLLGGTVEGPTCKNLLKWGNVQQNCSLETLWDQSCPATPGHGK
jgi:hypothetical protein